MLSAAQVKFTVVMPVFNREALVGRAIESVLRQSYTHFELNVVDDGSTDKTAAVVESLRDDRIKLLRQANQGPCVARNTGLHAATGTFVTFLDSDDEVDNDWLETFAVAAAEPNVGMVHCGIRVIHADSRVSTHQPPIHVGSQIPTLNPGSYAVRVDIVNRVGAFLPGLPAGQHNEMRLRLQEDRDASGFVCRTMQKSTVTIRRDHPFERVRHDPAKILAGAELVLRNHGPRLSSAYKARLCSVAGVASVRTRRLSKARVHFLGAIRAEPRSLRNWARFVVSLVSPAARYVWSSSRLKYAE